MQDTALMLHTLLELGESMLADGADVRRVEQTLTRMGLAYGAVRMDVFVITSSIVLTMCFPDETSVTQTRRIEKSAVTDFGKLEAINAISRSYCEKPFPVQELADRLHLAKGCSPARWKLFAGSSLGAGALTVFFGGAWFDGLAAAIFALGNILNAGMDQVMNMYSPQVYMSGDILDTYIYRIGLEQAQYSLSTAAALFKSVVSAGLMALAYSMAIKYGDYQLF